jgi:hypothetical protein
VHAPPARMRARRPRSQAAPAAHAGETLALPGGAMTTAHAGETLALPGSDRGDRHSFRSPAIAVAPR